MHHPSGDNGYGTDSESEDDAGPSAADSQDYGWGPEDDAPFPSESESGLFDDTASESFSLLEAPTTDSESVLPDAEDDSDDLPALVSDSEEDLPALAGPSDSDDDDNPHQPTNSKEQWVQDSQNSARPKITAYWRVETAEDKAVRMEREALEYAELCRGGGGESHEGCPGEAQVPERSR